MKLDMKNPADKQKVMAVGLIIVILLAAFIILKPMLFSGSSDTANSDYTNPPPGAAGGPPGVSPGPGTPSGPGAPAPGAPGAGGPTAPGGPAPGGPTATAPSPGAPSPASGAPAPPTASAQRPMPRPGAPAASPAGAPAPTKSITVFGSVTVTYPSGWGIGLGSAGSAAVISDGKARFEVRAPNPKATTAKAIADAALSSLGGKAASQGPVKVGGFDAYQYTTGSTRIVGVDAPTRVVLVESVKGGSMSAYRAAFDKMESGLSFR